MMIKTPIKAEQLVTGVGLDKTVELLAGIKHWLLLRQRELDRYVNLDLNT
jgi:hypothetical protein